MKESSRMCKWGVLLGMLLLMAVVIVGSKTTAIADVNVGDVVDSSNWQKVKGLLPDAMVEYVKKGYFTIKVGKLNYKPGDILSTEYKESMTKNLGKYGMNSKGDAYNIKTGEINPYDVIGLPFPVIDPSNPMAGNMTQSNHAFGVIGRGNMSMTATLYFVGQKMERYVAGPQLTFCFVGSAKNIARQPEGKQFGKKPSSLLMSKVTDPYELNGLTSMSWMYQDNTPDKVIAYIPALRRTRVLSAAAKSDAIFGSDYAMDDAAGGFLGNPRDFNCKCLRTQDTLIRFNTPDVIGMIKKNDGTYELKKNYPNVQYGFQTPGWKGKGWATTNQIWVKRKVNVFECMAKDPYYNYGKFELWADPVTNNYAHKIIYDRAGKRWKVMNMGFGAYKSDDGEYGRIDAAFGDWIYDEQRDHATAIDEFNTKEKKIFNANISVDSFTLLGLAKYGK